MPQTSGAMLAEAAGLYQNAKLHTSAPAKGDACCRQYRGRTGHHSRRHCSGTFRVRRPSSTTFPSNAAACPAGPPGISCMHSQLASAALPPTAPNVCTQCCQMRRDSKCSGGHLWPHSLRGQSQTTLCNQTIGKRIGDVHSTVCGKLAAVI